MVTFKIRGLNMEVKGEEGKWVLQDFVNIEEQFSSQQVRRIHQDRRC